MTMNGSMIKQAGYELNRSMEAMGREMNVEEISNIIKEHSVATALSAAASGMIPGAGGTVAFGIACTSTVTMYGRLAKAMGIKLNHGLLRAVASAVVADLAATVTASVLASAALSFIPGLGSMASSVITGMTNYGFVYLAGYIFLKMIASLGVDKVETLSESDMKAAAKGVREHMDMKAAMKEVKRSYKENVRE